MKNKKLSSSNYVLVICTFFLFINCQKKDIVSSENIAELNEFELFKIENNIIDDNIATEQYFKFKTKGQQVMNIDKNGNVSKEGKKYSNLDAATLSSKCNMVNEYTDSDLMRHIISGGTYYVKFENFNNVKIHEDYDDIVEWTVLYGALGLWDVWL